MKRREFMAASAMAFVCGGCTNGQENVVEKRSEKPREPDHIVTGHGGYIAFSPDSKVLAIANGPVDDGYGICFVDPNTGKRLPDFDRTTDIKTTVGFGYPRVLAFSPDGRYFAAGGNGYVAIWNSRTGRRLEDISLMPDEPTGTVTSLAFTPDSKRILLGFYFRSIEQSDKDEKLTEFDGYDGVAFSTNGKLLATRLEGIITLWSYPGLKKLKEFGRKQPTGGPLIFSPNGSDLFTSHVLIDNRSCYFWNVETGQPIFISFPEIPCCDLSPDGLLVPAITDAGVALLRTDNGQMTYTLHESGFRRPRFGTNENTVVAIKFSASQTLVALSRVSGIHIWKEKNGFKI